ncbi:MAG: cell division protein ZipA [Cognaticolwellia sp.]
MEDNFRNTLIILSAIVIAAIFIHGYWTIRKQKNPYKLKTKDEPVLPQSRGFDGSGFDQDGVSKPKVIGSNPQHDEVTVDSHRVEDSAEFHSDEPMPSDVPPAAFNENQQTQDLNFGTLLNDSEEIPEHLNQQANMTSHVDDDLFAGSDEAISGGSVSDNQESDKPMADNTEAATAKDETPVYQQPVTHAKPEVKKPVARKKNVRKTPIKRNQMEINFGDEAVDDMPSMSATSNEKKPAAADIEPQVIVLSVVMQQGQAMSGAALLPTLLTLGMKYGEMNIFHRHQDNAGNGKVTFSLANLMKPGTFDLDDIENFSTQGITLFMTLPNAGDAFEVFEQMLSAAKQLAVEFGGQLLDDKRSVMTKQTEQHYMGLIREFERKSRIGSV